MAKMLQLILHWLGRADHPNPWTGPTGDCYVTDIVATSAYFDRRYRPPVAEKLKKILGTGCINATIQGREYLIAGSQVEESKGYKPLIRGRNFILSQSYSAVWERTLRSKTVRDETEDGYWLHSNYFIPCFRERFMLMTPEEFQIATANLPFDAEGFPIVTTPDEACLAITRKLSIPLKSFHTQGWVPPWDRFNLSIPAFAIVTTASVAIAWWVINEKNIVPWYLQFLCFSYTSFHLLVFLIHRRNRRIEPTAVH